MFKFVVNDKPRVQKLARADYKNWNDLVAPNEAILHLGDFALGNKTNFDLLTGMLKGRLFLIQGNHDQISKSYCETRGWINFHGHIHNVPPPPEGSNFGPSHINMSV